MKLPQIKSNKQLYRLWFEFLKMAHKEPDLQANLALSADFYAPWGDVQGQLFDPWWKEHKHLFGQTYVKEVDRVTAADNVLYVAIPLNQPASRSLVDVKELIEGKQRARLVKQGGDPETVKTLSAAFGQYSFTQGVEIRGRVLYEIQLMFETGKSWVSLLLTQIIYMRSSIDCGLVLNRNGPRIFFKLIL